MNCVPPSCQDTCVQSVARHGLGRAPTPLVKSRPIGGYNGLKSGVGNMGDEYCEDVSGDVRCGDRKYPVSLGATCEYAERTNGELWDGPEEGPACKPIETAVMTGELSNEGRVDDPYRHLRETRGIPSRLVDWATSSLDRQKTLGQGSALPRF